MDDLTPRKRTVLAAIITMHTADGEPVGSKTLLEGRIPLNVSSATLRSEMAQLTDIGLLMQPHVSAGRVPTVEGYKYYVHRLVSRYPVSDAERSEIYRAVSGFDTDPDRACESAARLLAKKTGLAGVATTPEGGNLTVAHFKLIRVGRYNIAVIGITSSGGVRSRVCRTGDISEADLAKIEATLNRTMVFRSHLDLGEAAIKEIADSLGGLAAESQPIVEAARQAILLLDEAQVFVSGAESLLKYRELNLAEVLKFLSNERQLRNLVKRTGDSISAFVADETGSVFADSLSVLLGKYRCGNGLGGGLGVVGPLRINYEYVIPRLQCLCDMLSDQLIGA